MFDGSDYHSQSSSISNLIHDEVAAVGAPLNSNKVLSLVVVVQMGQQPVSIFVVDVVVFIIVVVIMILYRDTGILC